LLRILGDASLIRADLPDKPVLILGPGKLLAVLAYLACAPSRRARTEELLDVFWRARIAPRRTTIFDKPSGSFGVGLVRTGCYRARCAVATRAGWR